MTKRCGSMCLRKASVTFAGVNARIASSCSAVKAKVRPLSRLETICPAIAASLVRPTFWASMNAFFASTTSLSVGPSLRNRSSSSMTAAVTLPMFNGLVLTVTVSVPAGSREDAVNDEVAP